MGTFGYYGLQGIMAVYLVKQLGMLKRIQSPFSLPLVPWFMVWSYRRLVR